MCFWSEHNCNWGEAVAVAAGAGTDAQDRYFKQVVSQMGKVSNNHVFLLPRFKVFDGGQPANTEVTNCSEKEEAEPDQAVMDAEQIFIDKNLYQNLL